MKLKYCLLIVSLSCICAGCIFFAMTRAPVSYAESQSFSVRSASTPDGFVKICADHGGYGALDRDGKLYMYGKEQSPPIDFPPNDDPVLSGYHIGLYSPPFFLPPIVDMALGDFHAVALGQDGELYSWGLLAELAPGIDCGQISFPDDLPPIKAIAAAGLKTMLLTDDGKVLSFGDINNGGQEYVPDMPRVVAIACSAYTSLALDKDGYVHAWGLDFPSPVVIGPNVVGISAVDYDFIYLGADGRISEYNDLSNYTDTGEWSYRPFTNLTNIKKIAGSSYNYAAIDYSGGVTVWGKYHDDPSGSVVEVPEDLGPIQDVGFTTDSAIALGEDGKLYVWGPAKYDHVPLSPSPILNNFNTTPGAASDDDANNSVPEDGPAREADAPDSDPSPIWLVIIVVVFAAAIRLLLTLGFKQEEDRSPAAPATGDQELDEVLGGVAGQISGLRKLSKDKQDKLYGQVQEILKITEQIVEHVRKTPAEAKGLHQFFNYTFPTTVNLLENYYELKSQPIQGRNIVESIEKIEGAMGDIVDAFHRQLDALFSDEALGIDIEIEVMKNMLAKSGSITDTLSSRD